MLLDPSALRRRLPLILVFVLASMLLGAGWAASRTPVYRSTAVVRGPSDLATIVRSSDVADGFRTRVAAIYGEDVAATTVAFASQSGERVELATESEFAGVSEELTLLYTESVLAARPEVVLEAPASFPLSTRSPNLRRIGLVTFIAGATLGWVTAVAFERRSRRSAEPAEPARPLQVPELSSQGPTTPEPQSQAADPPERVVTPELDPAPPAPGARAPRVAASRAAGRRVARRRMASTNRASESPRVVGLPAGEERSADGDSVS